jgi:Mg2+/citrate symporter
MLGIFSNKPLSELSLEELKSREQSTQTFVRWWGGFVLVMLVLSIVWTFVKGYHSSNIMFLVGISPLLLLTTDKLKKIKVEISSRV